MLLLVESSRNFLLVPNSYRGDFCIRILLVYSQIFTVNDPGESGILVGNLLQNLHAIWDGVGWRRHDGERMIRRVGDAYEMFQHARVEARKVERCSALKRNVRVPTTINGKHCCRNWIERKTWTWTAVACRKMRLF